MGKSLPDPELFTGNERMRIDNNGNVGIGTTSPETKLHVEKGSILTQYEDASLSLGGHTLTLQSKNNWNQVPYIQWRKSDGIRQAYMGWRSDVFNLTLENGHNFSINGGNVGIGTITPENLLFIDAKNKFDGGMTIRGTNNPAVKIQDDNGFTTFYTREEDSGIFTNNPGGLAFLSNKSTVPCL